jgi:hypothetical protein
MRIGRQITEAMLLKNKANRKEGRETFNKALAILSDTMKQAIAVDAQSNVTPAEIDKLIKTFDSFNIQSIKLENSYNDAYTAAEELISMIEDILFLNEKRQKQDTVSKIKEISRKLADIDDKYFASQYTDVLKMHKDAIDAAVRVEKAKTRLKRTTVLALKQLRETANTFHILPTEQDINGSFYRNIFDYLKTSSQPTYNEAVNAATKRNRGGASKQQIIKAMKALMENDVISERTIATGKKGKKQKLLFVDWEKAEEFLQ